MRESISLLIHGWVRGRVYREGVGVGEGGGRRRSVRRGERREGRGKG